MQNARRIGILLVSCSVCILAFVLYLLNTRSEEPQQKLSKSQLYSYLVGYELHSQLREYQPTHTLEDIINGMRACHAGCALPDNMTREQKAKFLNEMEYELFHEWEDANRAKAEAHLLTIDQEATATACVPLRLYYQIIHEGTGTDLLLPDATALFHYTITTLDNKEVFTTRNQDPVEVYLSDAIPGFAQDVVGMRKNERRKMYIHPDLAYHSTAWHVPPQSLLIIDVELLSVELLSCT